MKQKKIISLITAVFFCLTVSDSSMAFDFSRDETFQRNREQLAIQSAEIARQRAEIEALKQEQATEASGNDDEAYQTFDQTMEAEQNPDELQYQDNASSLSWGQLALLGLGALVLLSTLPSISGGGSASTDHDSSGGGAASIDWDDELADDPWDDVNVDNSIGCVWGDRDYETCVQ